MNRLFTLLIYLLLILPSFGICSQVFAVVDVYSFETPQQETRYRALIDELRCPKCQNQNLAGSDSQIAQDLKRKTYEMVIAGNSDEEIRTFMVDRYGDFISYKPPIKPATYVLWFLPPFVLAVAMMCWFWHINQRNKRNMDMIPPVDNNVKANIKRGNP